MQTLIRVRLFRLVAVVAALSSAACMGSFALTKGLYHWNETVTGSKVVNNILFWALGILPVYDIAVAGDLIVFNTIEFWTGKNLLADGAAPGDTRVAKNADGSVTLVKDGVAYVATPDGDKRATVTRDGALVGALEQLDDGSLVVTDAHGVTVAVMSPDEAHELAPTIAKLAR